MYSQQQPQHVLEERQRQFKEEEPIRMLEDSFILPVVESIRQADLQNAVEADPEGHHVVLMDVHYCTNTSRQGGKRYLVQILYSSLR